MKSAREHLLAAGYKLPNGTPRKEWFVKNQLPCTVNCADRGAGVALCRVFFLDRDTALSGECAARHAVEESTLNERAAAIDRPLAEPRVNGSVWPFQYCPAFMPRSGALEGYAECWYCRYADFCLKEPVALDVGICRWPNTQID